MVVLPQKRPRSTTKGGQIPRRKSFMSGSFFCTTSRKLHYHRKRRKDVPRAGLQHADAPLLLPKPGQLVRFFFFLSVSLLLLSARFFFPPPPPPPPSPRWPPPFPQETVWRERLRGLRHAASCPGGCRNADCPALKKVLAHIENCDGGGCSYDHCASSRGLLAHAKVCRDRYCPVCPPYVEKAPFFPPPFVAPPRPFHETKKRSPSLAFPTTDAWPRQQTSSSFQLPPPPPIPAPPRLVGRTNFTGGTTTKTIDDDDDTERPFKRSCRRDTPITSPSVSSSSGDSAAVDSSSNARPEDESSSLSSEGSPVSTKSTEGSVAPEVADCIEALMTMGSESPKSRSSTPLTTNSTTDSPRSGLGSLTTSRSDSQLEISSLPPRFPFLVKLQEIVQDHKNKDIIRWTKNLELQVLNKRRFEEDIMPLYFTAQGTRSRFSSFSRQLNNYGFENTLRGPKDCPVYRHVDANVKTADDFLKVQKTSCVRRKSS